MWRPVIFLHLVKSVNAILGCLKTEIANLNDHGGDSGSAMITVPRDFTDTHAKLLERLEGFNTVQRDLEVLLELEESTGNGPSHTPDPFTEDQETTEWNVGGPGLAPRSPGWWKRVVSKLRAVSEHSITLERIAEALDSRREDIRLLWENMVVKELLLQKRMGREWIIEE